MLSSLTLACTLNIEILLNPYQTMYHITPFDALSLTELLRFQRFDLNYWQKCPTRELVGLLLVILILLINQV